MKQLFGKIETREDAIKVIKDASSALFFVAALNLVLLVIVLQNSGAILDVIIDVIIWLVLGIGLRKFQNKIVAILILLMSLLTIGVTVTNRLGISNEGGSNIILAVILLWISIRAIQASWFLSKK